MYIPNCPQGAAQVCSGDMQNPQESMAQSLHCAFRGTGKIGQGGENGLGLASLYDVWRVWV